jgi:hypothetical protein
VVPTRNRASLLKYALQSVVQQTFSDFELIVSDNWSTDDTADVVHQFGEQVPIKLLQPPRPMPMSDHWNFALSAATGQWVLLLGDDDFFSRDLLATVRAAIEESDTRAVTWHFGSYHHNVEIPPSDLKYVPSYFDPARINKLDVLSWTGRTYTIEARQQLARLYAFEGIYAPCGHVSALRRDLIEDIVRWAGTLFHPPYPDFGCSAAVLATAESMTLIDVPLHVLGRVPRLGKYSYLLSNEGSGEFNEAMASEYGRTDFYDSQPVRSPMLIITNIAATLAGVRELMPAELAQVDFDWERYFIRCRGEISAMTRAGFETTELVAQYDRALASQPEEVRRAVRSAANVQFPRLADTVSRLKTTDAAHSLRRMLYERRGSSAQFPDRTDLPRWRSTVDGARAGFANIAEAADALDGLRAERASKLAPA